jgi:hypothetical protein
VANPGVVTLGPWQLISKIVALLRTEIGLVDDDLAGRLSVPVKDIRRAVAIGYNQGKLDRCWTGTESYVVLPSAPAAQQAVSIA